MSTNSSLDFMRLVFRMRSAQKKYFKDHTTSALNASKRLEEQVDEYLKQIGIETEKIQQIRLDLGLTEKGE
jgi:type IV pilus biogenesis protein CpaD/CtpE